MFSNFRYIIQCGKRCHNIFYYTLRTWQSEASTYYIMQYKCDSRRLNRAAQTTPSNIQVFRDNGGSGQVRSRQAEQDRVGEGRARQSRTRKDQSRVVQDKAG